MCSADDCPIRPPDEEPQPYIDPVLGEYGWDWIEGPDGEVITSSCDPDQLPAGHDRRKEE